MLLLLGPTEQEIEQVFSGRRVRRQHNGAGYGCGKHHAAAHGPIRQLCTQRQLHRRQKSPA